MGPYAGVNDNLTLCPLQSRLQHIYHGQIRVVYPGSRILILPIPDLGSRISDTRIPDPKTATKERGEKKHLSYLFL
jgi:hypothetical protein